MAEEREAQGLRWEGGCRSRWALPTAVAFAGAGIAVAAAGIAGGAPGAVVPGAILVAAGLPVLALVEVHVQVTGDALRVLYAGSLRRPVTTVPLADVETAEVVAVRPMRHGGWGYRGSLRLLRRAAVILRKGPGARFGLRGGRVFLVTVDDPDGLVAAVGAARLSRGGRTGA